MLDDHGGRRKKLLIAVDVLDSGGFDCDTCDCINGVLPEHRRVVIKDLGVNTRGCPIRLITPFTWQLIDYHRHYKAGYLPFPGSISDQPAFAMRAISLIDGRIRHNQEEQRRRNAKKTTG